MSTTTLPYEWLKEVPTALLQQDDIPLLGFPPLFPFDQFNQLLKQTFATENIEVKPLTLQWRSKEDLFSALGQDLIPIHFQIPSLDGDLVMVFANRDIQLMMSLFISKQKEPLDIIDPEFQNGFIHFLGYEVINLFNQCNFDSSLNPHIAEKTTRSNEELKDELLQRERSLCQDISCLLEGNTFIFRLIISEEFRKSWKEKYATRTLDIPLNPKLAEKIQIPVALEIGKVNMPLTLWKKIKTGDFVVLDFCSMDPTDDKGRLTMTVNGNRFFRARLKSGSLKILEHPLFHEDRINNTQAEKDMAKEIPEDDHSEFGESEFDSEFSEFNDTTMSGEDSNFDESTTDTHETKAKTEVEGVEDAEKIASTVTVPKMNENFKPEEISLDITIEVGRLQMSIQKLNELQPGNVLEIDVHPENGVDLVVNGKRIAKGELLKLGEVLGVRILDI